MGQRSGMSHESRPTSGLAARCGNDIRRAVRPRVRAPLNDGPSGPEANELLRDPICASEGRLGIVAVVPTFSKPEGRRWILPDTLHRLAQQIAHFLTRHTALDPLERWIAKAAR